MHKKQVCFLISILTIAAAAWAVNGDMAAAFVGQDLKITTPQLLADQPKPGEHVLVMNDGFNMTIGANKFQSEKAVVWINKVETNQGNQVVQYRAKIYMEGKTSIKKGRLAKTSGLTQTVLENGNGMFVYFDVKGQVFVTADNKTVTDLSQIELYQKAVAVSNTVNLGPVFVVQTDAIVPEWIDQEGQTAYAKATEKTTEKAKEETVTKLDAATKADGSGKIIIRKGKAQAGKKTKKGKAAKIAKAKPRSDGLLMELFKEKKVAADPNATSDMPQEETASQVKFRYPVNLSPAGENAISMDKIKLADGTNVAIIRQRFYIWQKKDENGGLLELQADNAVIYYQSDNSTQTDGETETVNVETNDQITERGAIKAVYISGDVVMAEGNRTIRSDELYYDFYQKKALAINAEMKNFDVNRGIPIYVRAAKIRQVSENKFSADKVTLTSSEFYLPQLSATAASVIITDITAVNAEGEKTVEAADGRYDVQMEDLRVKYGKRTIFRWPYLRSDLERPDLPIKSLSIGNDNKKGTAVETRWYLSRLMGWKEPEGVESTLAVDFYSKRGPGAGLEIDYDREEYFGDLSAYVMKDRGEDTLGGHASRKDIDKGSKIRGKFDWRHRAYLPNNWQVTGGISYASDERYIEQFFNKSFHVEEKETYIHLKQSKDNWAIAFLAKARINDFADDMEELPSGEFHLTGESLFDDKFTLYSDTEAARLRQRIGNDHMVNISERDFTFISHRTELDMPIQAGKLKLVPFVAATYGYDDRSGFRTSQVNGANVGRYGSTQIVYGEVGLRIAHQPWHKVYPNVKSRLWDLNQLRHVIEPSATIICYGTNDSVTDMRDMVNIALSQRLQTKRGQGEHERTVDWMRLNMEMTFVEETDGVSDAGPGPDRFIWNKPSAPLKAISAPQIYGADLLNQFQRFEIYGPRRNYFAADYIWRISDSTSFLADVHYDLQSGVVDQLNVGFARTRWPNLSYYIGSRYLRRVAIDNEIGSNSVLFAATYRLDPRYTLVFSQEFDFDYEENIKSEITLIRRYHRMFVALTLSANEVIDQQAIVLSIWPQGIDDVKIGHGNYVGLGGMSDY